jgi:hypothetical protein
MVGGFTYSVVPDSLNDQTLELHNYKIISQVYNVVRTLAILLILASLFERLKTTKCQRRMSSGKVILREGGE